MAKEQNPEKKNGAHSQPEASPSPKPGAPAASASQYQLTRAEHNGAVEHLVDLPKMWAIVKKNWMVLKGDRVRLVPLFMMPMLMIVIFGYAAGNLPKHLPTAVADYDHSTLSGEIIAQLSSMEAFSIRYQVGSQDEGKRMLDAEQIKVLFVIPPGFSQSVAEGRPATISLMVDESDSSVAASAKGSAQAFSAALSQSILSGRLVELAAQSDAARGSLALSRSKLSSIASADPSAQQHLVDETNRQAADTSSASSAVLSAQTLELQNSLGLLVDQNQIADSFTPSAVGGATLIELATGDSQASTLQKIALYQGLQASQSALASGVRTVSSQYGSLAAQTRAHASSARTAISLQDQAGHELELISSEANSGTGTPILLQILQPYGYGRRAIDFLLPAILALTIFQGATMGLGRAIAGERQDGSMTRVFLTPTSNVTIIFGTQVFYMLLETVRSSLVILVAMALFGVTISGHLMDLVVIIALFAMGATGVGMVLSVMAKTQEQYMALAMMVSMPIIFLSGAFFPVQTMPPVLQSVANFLPVTYAADALRGVMVKGFSLYQLVPDLVALLVFGLFTFVLSLMLFKREIA
ncbi:ABC-2 family transporter protein [uncultured archaeon]|nr:ABC-2 family transporter protein [uncultured archaeon]